MVTIIRAAWTIPITRYYDTDDVYIRASAPSHSTPVPGLDTTTEPGARWQSGYAAACKAVYAGSIPTLASNLPTLWAGKLEPSGNHRPCS